VTSVISALAAWTTYVYRAQQGTLDSIRVTRAQLKKGILLQAGLVHKIVVVPSDLAFTEFENVLFNHDCSALLAHTGEKPSDDEAEPVEERLGHQPDRT
jgi:hypothetical protein